MQTHQLEGKLKALRLSGMLATLEARLAQARAGEITDWMVEEAELVRPLPLAGEHVGAVGEQVAAQRQQQRETAPAQQRGHVHQSGRPVC